MCTANFSARISSLCLSRQFIYSPYHLVGNCICFPIHHSLICLPNGSSRCSPWASEPPSPRSDPCPPLPGPPRTSFPALGPLPQPGHLSLLWVAPTINFWNVTTDPRRGSTSILTWLWRRQTDRQIKIFAHTFVSVGVRSYASHSQQIDRTVPVENSPIWRRVRKIARNDF